MNWKFMITMLAMDCGSLGNSFGLSKMAAAWEMFKSNPLKSLVASITPSSQRSSLLSDFSKLHLPEKSHKTSSSVRRCVSGPEVNSGSNSGGQLNHPGDGVAGASGSVVGSAGGGIVTYVGVSGDPQSRMGDSHVPPDHGLIAGSGDSSQNAVDPFPVEPPLNFEDDDDDDNDTEAHPDLEVGNVTGWVAGEEEVGREDDGMHWDNAVGDNLSLPLEHILYYNGYSFEEVMEFVWNPRQMA